MSTATLDAIWEVVTGVGLAMGALGILGMAVAAAGAVIAALRATVE